MQYVNLLGELKNTANVATFAKDLFAALGIADHETRESSNYVDGQYHIGRDGNMSITISMSDEEGNDDRPYWIHIVLDIPQSENPINIVDRIIYEKALPAGFQVARINNFGKRGEQRIDY